MKKCFLRITAVSVLCFGLILTAFFDSACAQGKTDLQGGGGRIEGTWDVRVTLRNCQTGDEISSFDSMTTFISGGTLMDSTSRFPQSLKTPGHGAWRHISEQNYRFSFKAFTFDTVGNYTGYTILRHTVTLNSRATEYESAGNLEVYTPNGILVFTGCSTTTATRFE